MGCDVGFGSGIDFGTNSFPFYGIESMAPFAGSLSVGHHQNLWPPPSPWSAQSSKESSLHLPQAQLACAAQLASLPHTDLKTTSPANRDRLTTSHVKFLPGVASILSKLCQFNSNPLSNLSDIHFNISILPEKVSPLANIPSYFLIHCQEIQSRLP